MICIHWCKHLCRSFTVIVLVMVAIAGYAQCAPLSNTTSGLEGGVVLKATTLEYSLMISELIIIRAEEYFNELVM